MRRLLHSPGLRASTKMASGLTKRALVAPMSSLARRPATTFRRAMVISARSPVLEVSRGQVVRCLSTGSEFVLNVPSMGDSITEGNIVSWAKKPGDWVNVDDVVAVLETDKVSVDVRSSQAGVVKETVGEPGDTVAVGALLAKIDTTAPKPAGLAEAPAAAPKAAEAPKAAAPAPAPAAPSSPPPSPPKAAPPAPPKPAPAPTPLAPSSHQPAGSRTETRVKMTRMRIRIAERLKAAQNTAACLTTMNEVDMTNLIELRNKHKDGFEKQHGVKLGFMSAFVKAATAALQEIPTVNGYIDDATKEIVYRNYCDISVAVASPNGLVVPVLRNTENMSFQDVEKQIMLFGKKAKDGTLALEDMAGGTFTISNGGVFGSLLGTPIINPPQSAILGMHATKLRPAVVNGKVEARPMMYLALTYDHRLIDGREAVTFLKSICNKIEDPARLLLGL